MKANKVIWYGNTPPKNDKGEIVKDAVFDKRIKRIGVGEDVSGIVKDKGVKARMLKDGIIAEKVDPAKEAKAKEDEKSLKKVAKISGGEGEGDK